MALIISPNLTADRTLSLPELIPGAVLRPPRPVVTAGSKGLNVGRVLSVLGQPATLVGFVPDDDAALVRRLFGVEPVELVGVPVPGQLRVATIYLEDSGRVTVLNEPGPDVGPRDWARLEAAVQAALADGTHRTLVCSGSLPPGTPDDAYGRLTDLARAAGATSVVDASSAVLRATAPHHPDLVTPNLAEAETALGLGEGEAVDEQGTDVADRAVHAAGALVDAGARHAVVTAGGAGAALADGREVRWIPAVPIQVRNPIGAGDSFVGGYVHALESGAALVPAVLRGLATATASCEHPLAGGIDRARVDELADIVASRMAVGR